MLDAIPYVGYFKKMVRYLIVQICKKYKKRTNFKSFKSVHLIYSK